MKKRPAKTKMPAHRRPQSKAAKERVRRHLAGESTLVLDPAEAAGAPFISLEERARARYLQRKQEQAAETAPPRRKKPTA